MSALEGWARAWLVEPKYVTVFKPTMDVVRHYFSPFEFQTSSFIVSHQELIGEGLPVYYISSFGFISHLKSQQKFNNRWRTTYAPLLWCSPPSCSRSTLPCHLALDQSSAFSLKVFLRHELLIIDVFFFLSKECLVQTKLSNWRCPLLPWLLLSTMQTSTRWQKQRLIFLLASLLKKEKFKS